MPYYGQKAIMSSVLKVLFLGTGTSTGVPQIGCACKVCRSKSLKNKRLRSSILVSTGNTKVLVDSSSDLRQQALRENIISIDAVVYTHSHLDHVSGFDDLRAFCWGRKGLLPLYGGVETLASLERMYPWAFSRDLHYQGYVRPEACEITPNTHIGDLLVTPVLVEHASVETFGYLMQYAGRKIAYIPDFIRIPDASMLLLQGLDVLILDALRYKAHSTHSSMAQTLELIAQLQPRRAYLTHMSHDVDYVALLQELPEGIYPAYDGLCISVDKC